MASLQASQRQLAMSTIGNIAPQTDREAVERFIEQLSAFPLDSWLSVAVAASRGAAAGTDGVEAVQSVVTRLGLGVDAWNIADDVDTAAQYSLGSVRFAFSPRDCDSIRLARQAATNAALGLFLRPMLTANDFDVLYQPFVKLVPTQPGHRSLPTPARVMTERVASIGRSHR